MSKKVDAGNTTPEEQAIYELANQEPGVPEPQEHSDEQYNVLLDLSQQEIDMPDPYEYPSKDVAKNDKRITADA